MYDHRWSIGTGTNHDAAKKQGGRHPPVPPGPRVCRGSAAGLQRGAQRAPQRGATTDAVQVCRTKRHRHADHGHQRPVHAQACADRDPVCQGAQGVERDLARTLERQSVCHQPCAVSGHAGAVQAAGQLAHACCARRPRGGRGHGATEPSYSKQQMSPQRHRMPWCSARAAPMARRGAGLPPVVPRPHGRQRC